MKAVFCLIVLIGAALSQDCPTDEPYDHTAGQPACETQQEITIRYWRNNWDPVFYWICETLNVAASIGKCETNSTFFEAERQCVPVEQWQWTFPCNPPSRVPTPVPAPN